MTNGGAPGGAPASQENEYTESKSSLLEGMIWLEWFNWGYDNGIANSILLVLDSAFGFH